MDAHLIIKNTITTIIGKSLLNFQLTNEAQSILQKALALLDVWKMTNGLKILGMPLGSKSFANEFLTKNNPICKMMQQTYSLAFQICIL